ncbi:MAG: CaiB/BaiF CoA transferase family protein, partial [Phenylobacterium sp.]
MLNGFRVIELATYIAAPAAAGILADWGADVIKVEAPGGDPGRRNSGALSPAGPNAVFEMDNRGKRGICLDISKPEGRKALLELIRSADAFVTNLRPSALRRAGLDWPALETVNPRLIYASVTGFGLAGADADRPGFDVAAFWARAGVAGLMVPKGEEPFPLRTGLGDHTCGLATALGVMTAAYERHTSGRGRLVETSLLRSGVYAVGGDLAIQLRYGRVASTKGRKQSPVPLINFFQSADGQWVCLMPRTRADWPKMAAAVGRPELAEDPRFLDDKLQRENVEALVTALDEAFAELTYQEMAERLTAADLVWSPV